MLCLLVQADMDLQMVGMQPALYHRYNMDENEEEEDEDNEPFKTSFNADNYHGTQVRHQGKEEGIDSLQQVAPDAHTCCQGTRINCSSFCF